MKKLFLSILVFGLLLSGCASGTKTNYISDGYPKKIITMEGDYPDIIFNNKRFSMVYYPISRPINDPVGTTYPITMVELKDFGMNKNFANYDPFDSYILEYKAIKEKYSDYKYFSNFKIETSNEIFLFKTYGFSEKEAEEKLIPKCKEYKKIKNLNIDCLISKIRTRKTTAGKWLDKYEDMYLYAEKKMNKEIKERKEFQINHAKIKKEIKAKKLADNKKRCEEIGFTLQTESFAKCVLKLIELAEIRESALIESRSRASLEADMQQQQIDIQDQIASEAKASRDQQAWGVLLGMTMGSGILDSSSGGLFSSSTVSCNKTGETTSGTNKICYYNCMGSTKTINVGSMQFCPININK